MGPYSDMEHPFTVYVRTKTVFQHRLKDLKDYSRVKIYMYELAKLGVNGPLLDILKRRGEIDYDRNGNFKTMRNGRVDPSLLERTRKWKRIVVPLTPLHLYMRQQLMSVSLDCEDDVEIPVYFKTFLEFRDTKLSIFFTVDGFSGRVHTPVVNLKGSLRSSIRLSGQPVTSLDVRQMQPTILAKVLFDAIGKNPFSTSIFSGQDVYELLLQKNTALRKRSEAKKFLFQLIFGKPMDDIGSLFVGDNRWVEWINNYKRSLETKNPHGKDRHTNLAWLLQYSEVEVMTSIWTELKDKGIPFLTIHDDVLVRAGDRDVVYPIMKRVLSTHFTYFEITVKNHQESNE